jgi:ketosteroid isomerase-like protein
MQSDMNKCAKPIKALLKITVNACLLAAIVCHSVIGQEAERNIVSQNLPAIKQVEIMKEKRQLKESINSSGIQSSLSVNSYDETEKRNLKIIKDSFEEWRKGTGGPYGLLAENAEWTIVGNTLASKTYRSRKSFIEEVIEPFNARLTSRLVPTVKALYTDGDTVIAFFTAEATARDGKPYVNTYSWFLKMNNGQIVGSTAFFDAIAFNDFWNRVAPATK